MLKIKSYHYYNEICNRRQKKIKEEKIVFLQFFFLHTKQNICFSFKENPNNPLTKAIYPIEYSQFGIIIFLSREPKTTTTKTTITIHINLLKHITNIIRKVILSKFETIVSESCSIT